MLDHQCSLELGLPVLTDVHEDTWIEEVADVVDVLSIAGEFSPLGGEFSPPWQRVRR